MTVNGNRLVPDEGMILTNGDIYSDLVFLGKRDSVDNWREVELTGEIQQLITGEKLSEDA